MENPDILQKLIETKPILRVGGAFDSMSAKLVEINNFDAIWAGSFAISATHALPDASILTMTEFLNASSNIVESCKIPVIADCDTGYGGPTNVSHTVRKFESAGVSAICIEDKIFPKQNSLLKGGKQKLISEKEFVAKILAAKDAKINDNFMIIARTEALIAEVGMDEAIQRADAYENAGADAILIHSKKETPDEIIEFSELWKGNIPLVVVPTTYPTVSVEELIKNKFKMVIYANQSLRASYLAMNKVLKEIKNSERISEIKQEMTSMEKIFELQEMYEITNQEKNIEQDLKKMGYIDE
ncbi:MAG: phosphoenolpyruvate phosphomutase [Chloroflexi bacterium]|jgi:phosphoenolpyruvate phosphomutase|nr:phosphoenolpyruvate phosphomutase [Chloroflexota bacterium]|tara:strand:+ start:2589 stop:3488 length:900 start_codon:yes stop_codon:yes gene_type:complete